MQCVKSCLHKGAEKPGNCPGSDSVLSAFAAVCLEACKQDTQCPGLTKCCKHQCGVTCQPPTNLNATLGKGVNLNSK